MMGPTKFAPLIRQCRKVVEDTKDPKMYFVMMIITDGEIHDMEETINEIAYLAQKNLPVSFVIVGVGSEDFSNMVRLDGDEVAIKAGTPIISLINQILKQSKFAEAALPYSMSFIDSCSVTRYGYF